MFVTKVSIQILQFLEGFLSDGNVYDVGRYHVAQHQFLTQEVDMQDVGEVDNQTATNADKTRQSAVQLRLAQHLLDVGQVGGERHVVAILEVDIRIVAIGRKVEDTAQIDSHQFVAGIEIQDVDFFRVFHLTKLLEVMQTVAEKKTGEDPVYHRTVYSFSH